MEFPKLEVIPAGELLDKVVEVGLWLGHLVTRQFGHEPPSHGNHTFDKVAERYNPRLEQPD